MDGHNLVLERNPIYPGNSMLWSRTNIPETCNYRFIEHDGRSSAHQIHTDNWTPFKQILYWSYSILSSFPSNYHPTSTTGLYQILGVTYSDQLTNKPTNLWGAWGSYSIWVTGRTWSPHRQYIGRYISSWQWTIFMVLMVHSLFPFKLSNTMFT